MRCFPVESVEEISSVSIFRPKLVQNKLTLYSLFSQATLSLLLSWRMS